MKISNNSKILSIILWLVSLQSFLVGIGLIFMPSSWIEFLGFNSCIERFFSAQGGVFHIVMSIVYGLGACDSRRFNSMVILSIITKFLATIFLFTYFILVGQIWMVLLSGINDFIMAVLILWVYKNTNRKIVESELE